MTFTLDYVAYPEGSVLVKTRLDLCYAEDREADVDMNLVMTQEGRLIEVQGAAEGAPFSRRTMDRMLDLDQQGIHHLIQRQKEALAGYASGT